MIRARAAREEAALPNTLTEQFRIMGREAGVVQWQNVSLPR